MIDRPKAIIDLIAITLKSQKSFENELLDSISSKNKNLQADEQAGIMPAFEIADNYNEFERNFNKTIAELKFSIFYHIENTEYKKDKIIYTKDKISEIDEVIQLAICLHLGFYEKSFEETERIINDIADIYKEYLSPEVEIRKTEDKVLNAQIDKSLEFIDRRVINELILSFENLHSVDLDRTLTNSFITKLILLKNKLLRSLNEPKSRNRKENIEMERLIHFQNYFNKEEAFPELMHHIDIKNYVQVLNVNGLQYNNKKAIVEWVLKWLINKLEIQFLDILPEVTTEDESHFVRFLFNSCNEEYIQYLLDTRTKFLELIRAIKKIDHLKEAKEHEPTLELHENKQLFIKPKFKPEGLSRIFDILKIYFPDQEKELLTVLETGNIPSQKLLFNGNGVILLDLFKQLLKGQFIGIGTKNNFEIWISDSFEYLYRKTRKKFTPKYASKILSGYERAAECNRLIDIEKNRDGEFVITLIERQNRKKEY